MTRFISVDPSSTASGWAVFEGQGLVAWGKVDMKKVEYSFRFQFVVNELIHLTQVYHFQEIAIEETKYAWAGRNLSALRTVFISIQKWAERMNIPVAAYNVATWKNGVVGDVHATKEATKVNVCYRFPRLPGDLSDHEYDAIAIGVYHSGVRYLEALAKGGLANDIRN